MSRSRSRSKSYHSKDSLSPDFKDRERRSLSRPGRYRRNNDYKNDYYRTRSRTPRRHKGRYSRSRSRSFSPRKRFDRRRSYSGSPSDKYRHLNPSESHCLGVFGLNVYTTQHQITQIFEKYGPLDRVQVIIDAKTGRSRGFCFVYYKKLEDAKKAKENCDGLEVDSRRIRVDYSITQRPHTPTPGIYKGKATRRDRDRDYYNKYRDNDDDDDYTYDRNRYRTYTRRSPSPYRDRSRRYDRSRSRSYSQRERRYR